ncbi:16S rRNA (guanine(966)-N(2))-methyltransferase RsmD [Spiroplasma platyhelix]|uniref:16S rRNA (Guanine(966)-N(2))-methyltransferase RsmD n=1 Tax=Spiroplasma platyhelix PALS-1 TaxID=1276218 RepID=A0A846TW70_9MOLU|nr:16S rRNA (guanine(966)-N(2))-methyltransferase RsmD [Spiroplasma platyhelix]MBE4703858.1 Ribosomal RNA small subunit methyltransferase D [Spiroplasma platyhelix PALS-1]NKE38231.1 16S rRNA (guanine(966)-N(2))-methyltransferase RsmD [Spiroplasma platyhelix PALS-1]UJB29116.1 16S rRNA (guanine966-N2)-methyltransferase [Spiroplasma platyhelix PALS-1]
MNIIGGTLKGKKLITLEGKDTRPTLTRIKENIFNILQNYSQFTDLIVVDVFAGSGSLALESLSRQAKFAYLNDSNLEACKIIKRNIANCRFDKITLVSNVDYQTFFKTFKTKLDLLFIDPPFADITCQQWILDYCQKHNLLNPKALIVLETNVYLKDLSLNSDFTILSEKKYGKIYITIIQYQKQ